MFSADDLKGLSPEELQEKVGAVLFLRTECILILSI